MKYHDTGSRNPSEALSTWLHDVLTDEVAEFRVQTGYFSARALGLILPVLERATNADLVTKVLLGSNDSSTLKAHVDKLFELMGIPRANAHLGVVSFGRGLFHPKVYHVRRSDGTQAAFVGSANLTREGLALNIEAAISLDTRDGDDNTELAKIATAIDYWFVLPLREGITLIDSIEVIQQLVVDGILAATSPPRTGGGGAGTGITGPTLTALTTLPTIPIPAAGPEEVAEDDDFEQSVPAVAIPPGIALPTPTVAVPPTIAPSVGLTPAPTPLVVAGPVAAPATTNTALQSFVNQNAFWIETGALTGGSRNQLDLSMVTQNGTIAGSISLFGVNSGATGVVTSVTIRYQGVDYANNHIKFPATAAGATNGTWRLQLNGIDPNGHRLTPYCSNFVNKILLFTPLTQTHYEIAMVSPRTQLAAFKANSSAWDRNRGGGRHFGRI